MCFFLICRNRTVEAYCYEIPELRDWSPREDEGILRAKPLELEVRTVRRYQTLHIPDATVLRLKNGNRIKGISRRYLHCCGFVVSNAFPNNIVQLKTGEIVYVESFANEERRGVVVMMGREFRSVSLLLLCGLISNFDLMHNSFISCAIVISRKCNFPRRFSNGWHPCRGNAIYNIYYGIFLYSHMMLILCFADCYSWQCIPAHYMLLPSIYPYICTV